MEQLERIKQLKKEKNAIILSHYYTNNEIQEIADYIGDSFYLSKIAKNNNADVIIFCGVHFMAETAKILSPEKKVIIPFKNAGCQMADTITYEELFEFKKNNPDYKIVGYVNTTAEVKSLCDVCVTSSNALKIIKNYENNKVLYVPDQNLAKYYNHINNKNINYWDGYCSIHHNISIDDVEKAKRLHPNALLLVHPEAKLDVVLKSDFAGSTKDMIEFVNTSTAKEFIIGTEIGILYSLNKNYPDKAFYPLNNNLVCSTMKLTTLDDVENALLEVGNKFEEIILSNDVIKKAQGALNKMLELGK